MIEEFFETLKLLLDKYENRKKIVNEFKSEGFGGGVFLEVVPSMGTEIELPGGVEAYIGIKYSLLEWDVDAEISKLPPEIAKRKYEQLTRMIREHNLPCGTFMREQDKTASIYVLCFTRAKDEAKGIASKLREIIETLFTI